MSDRALTSGVSVKEGSTLSPAHRTEHPCDTNKAFQSVWLSTRLVWCHTWEHLLCVSNELLITGPDGRDQNWGRTLHWSRFCEQHLTQSLDRGQGNLHLLDLHPAG